MTTLQDKTPEELTRMLAELLGYTKHKIDYAKKRSGPDDNGMVFETFWLRPGVNIDDLTANDIAWREGTSPPPYATSYDAIMPCVKALTDKQTFAFIEHLRVIRNIQATGDFAFTWLMMTSSEADLTRALILVLQSK